MERRQASLGNWLFPNLLALVTLVQASSCASALPKGSYQDLAVFQSSSQLLGIRHEKLGLVQHSCNRWQCEEITLEACYEGLRMKALARGANAILLIEDITEGKGHGGGEIDSYSCSGVALHLKLDESSEVEANKSRAALVP